MKMKKRESSSSKRTGKVHASHLLQSVSNAVEEYAQVTRMLGNGRLEAMCFDGTKRMCHIRGKLRKKVWVNQGDIILVGLRDYQDGKGDGMYYLVELLMTQISYPSLQC